jgi:hypothetical protein
MGSLRIARASAAVALVAAGSSACAVLWGFEDPIDMKDAGEDGTVDPFGSDTPQGSTQWMTDDGPAADATGGDASPATDAGLGSPGTDAEAGGPARDGAAESGARDAGVEAAPPPRCATACLSIPAPWQGPLAIFEGMGSPLPASPACAAPYPTLSYEGHASPDAGPAQCSCTCGAAAGVTCGGATVTFYSDTACTKPCGTPATAPERTCTKLDATGCAAPHFTVSAQEPTGGSCTPATTKNVPVATWQASVRLCATSATPGAVGCDAGAVCVPASASPFEAQTYCVFQGGVQTCPAAFPVSHVYYAASADTRDCSPCSCSSPGGATCSGATLDTFGTTSCTNLVNYFPVPSACARLPGVHAALLDGGVASGGACTPDGGQATGSFSATTPTTVCCTQ